MADGIDPGPATPPRPPPVPSAPLARGLLAGSFIVLAVTALHFARALLLPITVSILVSLLLAPPVRWLKRRRVPEWIGAGILVFGTIGLFGAGAGLLAGPAAEWVQRSPAVLSEVEAKVRHLIRPLKAIQKSAQQVEQVASPSGEDAPRKVELQSTGLLTRVSSITAAAAAVIVTVVFLTYFLLATGEQLRGRLVDLPRGPLHRERMEHALEEIEQQTSRYLFYTTLISIGVGGVTWALLAVAGLPSAGPWGVVAGVLNFIPYLGALVTAVLIGAAALLSFDGIEQTLLVLGGFLVIHLVAGNVVTPAVLGRKLPLNPVALFLCLMFWGWVWGVPGAILAVPLTVMLQVICNHVDSLRPVALLLGN